MLIEGAVLFELHKLCATFSASVNINYRLPIKVYYRICTLDMKCTNIRIPTVDNNMKCTNIRIPTVDNNMKCTNIRIPTVDNIIRDCQNDYFWINIYNVATANFCT